MRKITKILVAILLIAVLSMTSVTAFANDNAMSPRLSHTSHANFSFGATPNGGHIDVTYYGYQSFARADLTVTIEKEFLFFFWTDVATWSASNTDVEGEFYDTIPLDGSGTYRATFTLTVTGKNGTVDTITSVIESDY